MKTHSNQTGFTVVEVLLGVIVLVILGFTGWFVYHATNNSSQGATAKATIVKSFADCKKAVGSIIEETYPETCVTKDGKSFTDNSQKFLAIKEWGVKIPLSGFMRNAVYTNRNQGDGLMIVSYVSLSGTACSIDQEGLGQVWRFTKDQKDVFDGQSLLSKFPNAKKLGDYYYAYESTSANRGCETSSTETAWNQAVAQIQTD